MLKGIAKGDFSLLAPIHINLSGIKAWFTTEAFEAAKILREACGAAGFVKYSGFWSIHDTCSPLPTLEGDSVVMSLQTARALLKMGRKVLVKGKGVHKNLAYVEELKQVADGSLKIDFEPNSETLKNEKNLLSLLKVNALYNIFTTLAEFNSEDKHKLSNWEKFNQKYQMDIVKMTRNHTLYMIGLYYLQGIERLPYQTDKNIIKHMKTIYRIWLGNTIMKYSDSLLETGFVPPETFSIVSENFYADLALIRPAFLSIVESAKFGDNYINSAISPSDGSMYESMLEAARRSALNDKDHINGFKEHL